MKHLCISLVSIIALAGCSRAWDIKCASESNTGLVLKNKDASQSPSGYSCSAYTKGSGFSTPLFTDSVSISGGENAVSVRTDSFNSKFDGYDWLITIFPHGKQFRITDIWRHKHTERVNDDAVYCYDPFSFKLNDSLINVPTQRYSGGGGWRYVIINY